MNIKSVLTIPADIPLLKTDDLEEIFINSQSVDVVIVPSRDRNGTNALFRRPPNVPERDWNKMGLVQKYNLWRGLLVYDRRTRKTKRSGLSQSQLKIASPFKDFKEEKMKLK
mgnify:CR=1 FL=1